MHKLTPEGPGICPHFQRGHYSLVLTMAFFSLHLSRQEATLNVTSIQGPRVVLTPKSWTVKHEAHRSGFDIQL
ncbi:hypothetical protein FD819_30980, partial [Klebsiella variicola]|nr:hypothetical protein [Klebsiella variicola]